MVVVLCAAGAVLFAWPFLGLGLPASTPALVMAVGLVAALAGVEAGTRRLDSRGLAVLAAVAALDAALRAAVVTGIGGFSPIFLLVLCAGWAMGPSFGLLCGATSLLASAVATGGLGPWLPYEMLATGWVGAAAGLAGGGRRGRPPTRGDLLLLAAVGVACGFAYGAVMDVWDWSFFRGTPGLGWVPGLSPQEAVTRFARFYAATSVGYDTFRAVGNALMVLLLARPVLVALGRLRLRMAATWLPAPDPPVAAAPSP